MTSSISFEVRWNRKPKNDRTLSFKLAPARWNGGKTAVAKRGITFSPSSHTFTRDNWETPVTITITYPENSTDIRDLDMRVRHKVGNDGKGTLFLVDVIDND